MKYTQNLIQKLLVCGFIILASTPAQAQITPDNTLGAESSRLTPNASINGASADRIDGGAARGSNLFHSFSDFNVDNGQRVYFGNPNGIQNILTRVTGGNASNILGTLGVDGGANLFLLNPNGIIFGQNASLDLRGSFVGTTANAIGFGEQGFFSASNPQAPPLLTVNPSALLYTQLNGGEIINRARPRFPEQGSRFLVGGNITFDGGQVAVVGNRLELGGLAGEGTVGLTGSGNELQLNFPSGVPRADLVLQNNAAAFTTNGGAIKIQAGNLNVSGNSLIGTILETGQGSPNSPAGDVDINATSAVTVDGNSSISSNAFETSLGDSGNITINAESIRLNNRSLIYTSSEKNRGSIRLNATGNVTLDGNNLISTFGRPASIGNSGDITVNARNINLSNRSNIDSGNIGQGRGGRITLQATDAIALASGSTIESGLIPLESGVINSETSGEIEIAARSLFLDGQYTFISSTNLSEGRSGNIRITTDDSISLDGYAYITSSTSGQGDGGNIQLTTRSLTLTNGGSVGTQTRGSGNSGNLLVNASDSVTLSGTAVVDPPDAESFITGSKLSTEAFSSGNSGQLTVNTGRLSIGDGGGILARTNSAQSSRKGDLTINASEAVEVVGTNLNGVSSQIDTATLGSNDAGNLTINTGRLSVRGGGLIVTEAREGSTGQAGNLTVNATDAVEVIGVNADQLISSLSTATSGAGNAGDLTINTRRLSVRDVGAVGTNAAEGSTGQAGNLTVNATDAVEVIGTSPSDEFSSVLTTSTSSSGNAGSLNITTSRLSVRDGAFVSTEARQGSTGQGGNLTVNATDAVEVVGTSPTGQVRSALTTSTDSSGNAGSLNITTGRFSIRNGGFVNTAAGEGSTGQSGDLTVNASEEVEVGTNSPDAQNSSLTSFTAGSGNAGRLSINTRRLSIRNGGGIGSGTVGSGQGGNLDINAIESVDIVANPADTTDTSDGIVTTTVGSGNAGDLNIRTQRLSVQNSGLISASTFNTGRGGNLTINASDAVEVAGISNDGNKTSRLSVRSEGEGAAGNITVNSPRISVRDRGAVTAQSNTVDGGNINLNADNLLLRRNGTISATAGAAQGAGNGGNITIDADFIIAVPNENSDITANAFQGRGGTVEISTQGIFGIQPREQLTPLSDITASSELGVQGQISITEPNVQPEQGLVELPASVLDASDQIAQTCPNGATASRPLGEFFVTGRGSLPPNPLELLAGTTSLSPLASIDGETQPNLTQHTSSTPATTATPVTIVEAQGWVKTANGKIALVASAPQATPSAPPTASACPQPNQK